MITFIETEFLKLKRSKIFFITILGALFVPFMLSMGIAYQLWQSPDYIFYFKDGFEVMKQFLFVLFGVEVFAIVSAYLFGREYSERTLKSILTTPISKIKYLCGKFLMFFIWTILLVLISYFGLILFGEVIGIKGLTFSIFSETLTSYLYNGVLLFLTMTPFAFFAIWPINDSWRSCNCRKYDDLWKRSHPSFPLDRFICTSQWWNKPICIQWSNNIWNYSCCIYNWLCIKLHLPL